MFVAASRNSDEKTFEAGVPEYWIIDVKTIAVHTTPSEGDYRHVEVQRDGDTLRPIAVPGVALAVSEIPR